MKNIVLLSLISLTVVSVKAVEDVTDARPHPGPLPQERENHPPHEGNADALRQSARSGTDGSTATAPTATNELSQNSRTPSFFPGERAGVRASVDSDSPVSGITPIRLTPEFITQLAEEMRTNHPALLAAGARTNAASASVNAVRTWEDSMAIVGGMAAREDMRREDGDILYGAEQKLPLIRAASRAWTHEHLEPRNGYGLTLTASSTA